MSAHALLEPIRGIGRPDAAWLALALLAQLASLGAYACVVRLQLRRRGVDARLRALLRATVGGIAIGATVPGGQAVSAAYWYRELRKEGAERADAARALAGTATAAAVSLAALAVAGVAVAGDTGPLAELRVPILVAAAVLAAAFAILADRDLAVAVGLAAVNWLLDCATLLAALAAVHASVPARSVLLTYALAQVVGSIPLLPGGGGGVEASLALGFAAFGHTTGHVLAGVILYRLISCWGLVPVGWLAVSWRRAARVAALLVPRLPRTA